MQNFKMQTSFSSTPTNTLHMSVYNEISKQYKLLSEFIYNLLFFTHLNYNSFF